MEKVILLKLKSTKNRDMYMYERFSFQPGSWCGRGSLLIITSPHHHTTITFGGAKNRAMYKLTRILSGCGVTDFSGLQSKFHCPVYKGLTNPKTLELSAVSSLGSPHLL